MKYNGAGFWINDRIHSKANEYARNHGLRQFSVYQGRWSAAARDFEQDIIPMCKAEGMGIAPWGALGAGRFKTEEQRNAPGGRNVAATEEEIKVSKVLENVATRKNSIITSVALAYVMHKAPYVFPIVGGRKVEQLKENIAALKLKLTEEDIAEIEAAVPFVLNFPYELLWGAKVPDNVQDVNLLDNAGSFEYVPEQQVRNRP